MQIRCVHNAHFLTNLDTSCTAWTFGGGVTESYARGAIQRNFSQVLYVYSNLLSDVKELTFFASLIFTYKAIFKLKKTCHFIIFFFTLLLSCEHSS